MATLKIVLRKKQNKDGTYPLCIRVIKDRKASYISIGHSLHENDWNAKEQRVKKSHLNATRLNNLLLQKRAEANNKLIELETKSQDVSSRAIKGQIKNKSGPSFFTQADIYIKSHKDRGKYGRYQTDRNRAKFFRAFLEGRDITFPEITLNLLKQFGAWLVATRAVGQRTVINYMMLIRTVYNQAIKSGLTDNKNYPFGAGKIVIKFPDSLKVGWNPDEVKLLENAGLTGYANHARNVWLVSFYFAGMRISDVLRMRWSDFADNRFQYGMSKNTKVDSLMIPAKVLAILEQYKGQEQKHDLVFPELKVLDELDEYEVQRKTAYASKRLGKELKRVAKSLGISKNISAHIARHTFGNIAGDRIPVQILQHLYRHSNITTTINYQGNFVHDKTDAALAKVLDF